MFVLEFGDVVFCARTRSTLAREEVGAGPRRARTVGCSIPASGACCGSTRDASTGPNRPTSASDSRLPTERASLPLIELRIKPLKASLH